MRPLTTALSHTTPNPPRSCVPFRMTRNIAENIIPVWITSVQTTAFRPPYNQRAFKVEHHPVDDGGEGGGDGDDKENGKWYTYHTCVENADNADNWRN